MAKCGFGDKLVDAYRRHRHQDLAAFTAFLDEWREDLKIELRTNASGYLTSRRKALADNIPNTFPELTMLDNYIEPITTITHPAGRKTFDWSKPFSMPKLVDFVTKKLDWDHCMIKSRFKSDRGIWAGLVLLELLSQNAKVAVKIARDRAHVSTGHEHEYRLEYDPSKFLITLDKCLDRHDPNEAKMAAHKAKSKDRSGVVEDEFSDEEPACPKKRGENKSVLWVHASVLRIASPQLVAEYEDLKQEKQEKKVQAEARKQAKARGEKLSPTRRKATTKAPKKVAAVVTPSESEVEEELRPVVPFNPTARPSNEQVSRSSPTLDDLFTSTKPRRPQTTATVKPKPSSSQSQCQAVASSSRASSVETIIDLCSSPEASIPLKAKKSHRPVLSDSSKGSDNVARIRKSPKKRQQQSPHSRSLLDDSEEELPELPDMLQLSQAATKRKSTAAQGGRLSFRSSKTTTSVTSRTGTKAASKSAADPPNRPAFKSKTIYVSGRHSRFKLDSEFARRSKWMTMTDLPLGSNPVNHESYYSIACRFILLRKSIFSNITRCLGEQALLFSLGTRIRVICDASQPE